MDNLAHEIIGEPEEGFIINDDKKAEWALKVIAEENADTQRLINVCETFINDYKAKIEKYNIQLETNTSYLKSQLQQYFSTVPHKSTKTQESYKLPSGTLKLKYQQPKFVLDDEKLLMYFRQNNYADYIQTKTTPKWAEFKAIIKVSGENVINAVTGEIVDGVVAQEIPAEFEVSI